MLRDGSHVREEDLDVVVLLRLVVLSAAAQRLEALAPAVRRDSVDLFGRRFALDDRSHEFRDGRAGKCRLDAVLDGRRAPERCQRVFAVLHINVGEICVDIGGTLLFQRHRILFAAVEQGLRHVRIHVVADDAILAHIRLLEAVGKDLRDLFLHIAAL